MTTLTTTTSVGLVKQIAPDGDDVRMVAFTTVRKEKRNL
jgi:hypothetical protein